MGGPCSACGRQASSTCETVGPLLSGGELEELSPPAISNPLPLDVAVDFGRKSILTRDHDGTLNETSQHKKKNDSIEWNIEAAVN